jgi:plastocyanin
MSLTTLKLKGKRGIFALALTLLLSLVLAACGDSPTAAPAATTTAAGVATTAAAAAPQTINIDIVGFKFSPQEVSIPAGSTVIWTNKDAAKHNVVADDKSFESPTLEKGQSFTKKFDAPATIGYFCSFHGTAGQGMIGKLTVTAAAAAATTASNATTAAQATTTAAVVATTEAPQTTAAVVPTTAPTNALVNFADDTQLSDKIVVNINPLPATPAGKGLYGWLVNGGTGANQGLGQLTPDAGGNVLRRFTDPKGGNLLANYDKFIVTVEALDPAPSAPSSTVMLSGQLPGPSLIHIRHLMVSFPATPGKIGLEVGLRTQTQELRRQAELMRDHQTEGQLSGIKAQAEILVNIIEGSKGPDFGDLDKNGQVVNPGDGYGLLKNGDQLGYLDGSKEHANLAAKAEGSTEEIKLHAGHVGITVDNASGWITAIRDRALVVLKSNDIKVTEPLVREILALANQSVNGVDLKGDGQILPIPGSGAVLTSYQHAGLMATLYLKGNGPVAVVTAPATTHADHTAVATTAAAVATTTVAPAATVAPATTAANANALGGPGQEIKIDISQFKFAPASITIKAGTKITWTNQDTAPHTATADNSSWDSGTLQKGQSFSFTFNKAGLVKYHCEIHPNMTATITVV